MTKLPNDLFQFVSLAALPMIAFFAGRDASGKEILTRQTRHVPRRHRHSSVKNLKAQDLRSIGWAEGVMRIDRRMVSEDRSNMPAFAGDDVRDVISYVRTLAMIRRN
jgi:hypothetical protein